MGAHISVPHRDDMFDELTIRIISGEFGDRLLVYIPHCSSHTLLKGPSWSLGRYIVLLEIV